MRERFSSGAYQEKKIILESKKFYNIRELAGMLEISEQAARDLVALRKIAFRKIGGRIKISESDLQSFLKRTRVAAVDEV